MLLWTFVRLTNCLSGRRVPWKANELPQRAKSSLEAFPTSWPVGSEEARLRAGLRPPPKPCMQFSRTRLSRRLNESRTQEKESIRSDLPARTDHRAPTPAV